MVASSPKQAAMICWPGIDNALAADNRNKATSGKRHLARFNFKLSKENNITIQK